jgi:integrase
MASSAVSQPKIPTKTPQLRRIGDSRPARTGGRVRSARDAVRMNGDTRATTRGDDRVVVEVGGGVVVYPGRFAGDRWRAVWYEGGRRRQCQAATEDRLAARVEKICARLAADAPGLEQPGSELIAFYLSPDRQRAGEGWSRKHGDTQRRLCARYLAPVIGDLACEDIKVSDMQAAVNAAPTAGEGDRVRRCVSALVNAGIAGGYLTNPRLRLVHWQPGTRPQPGPVVTLAGESALFVDPGEIPAAADVARLGRALAAQRERDELMANFAAYTGLRWGELAALTTAQISPAARTVDVDRKVIEIGGTLYLEAPKGRKRRRTIYPRQTPGGYLLAGKVAERITQARAEQQADTNPLGLMFPSPRGRYWRSSNFARRVLAPAYQTARWRDTTGLGSWTWHSLRHVFCTTALFTWHIDPADVSRLAGHANIRITLDMYIGTTAGTLDRARTATQ